MDSSKLLITFQKHYEKEYFDIPKNAFFNFQPFDLEQKKGYYLKTMFSRKDQVCFIRLKKKNLWLHEKENNKFIFSKISCIKDGFDKQHPLQLWIEYTREPSFVLFKWYDSWKQKAYIRYKEKNGKVHIEWTTKLINATPFSYNQYVDWNEYQPDLVSFKKIF